jgi:hypothetical protein
MLRYRVALPSSPPVLLCRRLRTRAAGATGACSGGADEPEESEGNVVAAAKRGAYLLSTDTPIERSTSAMTEPLGSKNFFCTSTQPP